MVFSMYFSCTLEKSLFVGTILGPVRLLLIAKCRAAVFHTEEQKDREGDDSHQQPAQQLNKEKKKRKCYTFHSFEQIPNEIRSVYLIKDYHKSILQ